MSYIDLIAEHRRAADRAYRSARKAARDAERLYRRAAEYANHVAWLARCSGTQGESADWERMATACKKMGDVCLRTSFRETESARFYRGLARDYAAM